MARSTKKLTSLSSKTFDDLGLRVFRLSELRQVVDQHRTTWSIPSSASAADVIEMLLDQTSLKKIVFEFPHRPETRYIWREPTLFETLMTLKPNVYCCHYSAIFVHGWTDQIPKTIYLNHEQSAKPRPPLSPNQERIHHAFRQRPRETKNRAAFRGLDICLLNGKQSGQLGVVEETAPDGTPVRVTNAERTLIDAAVRPHYAGGVHEVLEAYRRAKERISANRMAAYLNELDYAYPYRQAIGFCMERAGYKNNQLAHFRKTPFEFDFYLTHALREPDYNKSWRLFIPKGF